MEMNSKNVAREVRSWLARANYSLHLAGLYRRSEITMSIRMIWILFIVSLLMSIAPTSRADAWRGTAPFCDGE